MAMCKPHTAPEEQIGCFPKQLCHLMAHQQRVRLSISLRPTQPASLSVSAIAVGAVQFLTEV